MSLLSSRSWACPHPSCHPNGRGLQSPPDTRKRLLLKDPGTYWQHGAEQEQFLPPFQSLSQTPEQPGFPSRPARPGKPVPTHCVWGPAALATTPFSGHRWPWALAALDSLTGAPGPSQGAASYRAPDREVQRALRFHVNDAQRVSSPFLLLVSPLISLGETGLRPHPGQPAEGAGVGESKEGDAGRRERERSLSIRVIATLFCACLSRSALP